MTSVVSLASTTTARVADRIRDDILNGRIAPGERIKILDFAARYGISHMPIREALRDLEGEGLIELSPHRGAAVRRIDARYIRNLYDVRYALEGLVAERAAERADAPAHSAIRAAAERHAQAAARGEPAAVLVLDRAFHDAVAAGADNPEAARALAAGRILLEALRLRYGYGGARLAAVVTEHAAITDAIAAGDGARAGDAARRHVIGARDSLLRHFT